MATKKSIPSRETGLRYEVETSRGTLPGSPEWKQLEPRSYTTPMGRENQKESPSPIVADRMARKSAVVSFRNNAGIELELKKADELLDLLKAALFAEVRAKREVSVTAATETGSEFTVSSGGDDYEAGDLFFVSGMDDDANNGLFTVTGSPTSTTVPVEETLTDASSQDGTGRLVGYEFAEGDLEIDEDGNLITTSKDLTDFGILPGEHISIGGDSTGTTFATSDNNTEARADSIAANLIELSKPRATMSEDDGSGKTVRLFFASRVLKNEANPADIVESWIQLERRMGAPDSSSPSDVQYQYLEGGSVSQVSISLPASGLVTAAFTFMGSGHTMRDAATGPKSGDRPSADLVDPFNTANNVLRSRLGLHDGDALVEVMSNLSLSIDNNMTVLDGSGKPAFDINSGEFSVTGDSRWFFQNFEAAEAIEGNLTGTFDTHLFRDNEGLSLDIPAMDMEGGIAEPVANDAIMVPVSFKAINGRHARDELDHALMLSFYDYLPDRAMPAQQT